MSQERRMILLVLPRETMIPTRLIVLPCRIHAGDPLCPSVREPVKVMNGLCGRGINMPENAHIFVPPRFRGYPAVNAVSRSSLSGSTGLAVVPPPHCELPQ